MSYYIFFMVALWPMGVIWFVFRIFIAIWCSSVLVLFYGVSIIIQSFLSKYMEFAFARQHFIQEMEQYFMEIATEASAHRAASKERFYEARKVCQRLQFPGDFFPSQRCFKRMQIVFHFHNLTLLNCSFVVRIWHPLFVFVAFLSTLWAIQNYLHFVTACHFQKLEEISKWIYNVHGAIVALQCLQ